MKYEILIGLSVVAAALLMSCATSIMEIRRDNPLSKEVLIVSSNMKNIQVGKSYMVYRTEVIHTFPSGLAGGEHIHDSGHTQSYKRMVGMVQVTKILDANTASAIVINGEVLDGDSVE